MSRLVGTIEEDLSSLPHLEMPQHLKEGSAHLSLHHPLSQIVTSPGVTMAGPATVGSKDSSSSFPLPFTRWLKLSASSIRLEAIYGPRLPSILPYGPLYPEVVGASRFSRFLR